MSPSGPDYASSASAAVDWSNASNATGLENATVASNATVGPGGGGHTPTQLLVTGFAFNLPSTAVIDGILLEAKVQTTGGSAASDYDVHLATTGGVNTLFANTPNAPQVWPTSALTWVTWGGSTSLWGRNWTVAEINSSSFGASLSAMPASGTSTINVDSVRLTVYWHTAPTSVPKRYIYQSYSSTGAYIGPLPNVLSDFRYAQEMNTAGAQISIEVGVSADTAAQPVDTLTDESGNVLTDESSNTLTDEGQTPIVALGSSGPTALIKNGNKIKVFEYGYWNPNGKQVFSGDMENWVGGFGGTGEENITILCYSDGSDLVNYPVRGNPYTYTQDQANTSQNTSVTVTGLTDKGTPALSYGQTFVAGVTNLGAVTLKLNGTATVTVSAYSSPSLATLLGTVTQAVSVAAATDVQFALPNSATTVAGTTYFLVVSVAANQSILLYYQNTDIYANGSMYDNSSGSFAPVTGDLYFKTFSGTGSTTGTFTSQDPTTGTLTTVMADYNARGGLVTYTASSIQATGLSLTYGFNTDTVLDAIKAAKSMSPNGFYWYIDLGSSVLTMKQTSTTADITLVKGQNLDSVRVVASIEHVKNTTLFTGGAVAGVSVYTQRSDATSIQLYGPRLSRLNDSRVTVLATAQQIAQVDVDTNKSEQFQSVVTVVDSAYLDTTTIKPGLVIGFAGFGTFVDNLLMQIVRVEYSPEEVTLTLGILPKRLLPEFDRLIRGLVAMQTVANPSTPS